MNANGKSLTEKYIGILECGEDKATAFLISPHLIVTATHTILDYIDSKAEIKITFPNIFHKEIVSTAVPIDDTFNSPITILSLNKEILIQSYMKFHEIEVGHNNQFCTFGYPRGNQSTGVWIEGNVNRPINNLSFSGFDWDILLNHESNHQDFSGLSGSPLFINNRLAGIILTQNEEDGRAINLGGISLKRFKKLLSKVNISYEVYQELEYSPNEVYELSEEIDYSDSMFIAMLESANIFDHECCREEFFNAEIARSSIASRSIDSDIKRYHLFKKDIKGIWRTKFNLEAEETDGNRFLASVYMRVEDLSESTLRAEGLLNLTAKKGVLHQIADEGNLGWTLDYKNRAIEYMKTKEVIND